MPSLLLSLLLMMTTAQDTTPPAPVRITVTIPGPKRLDSTTAEYPADARRAAITGVVLIDATVDETGRVTGTKVIRGVPLLTEPAVAAVKKWRYEPLQLNGKPTAFVLTATLRFGGAFEPPDPGTLRKLLDRNDAELTIQVASVIAEKSYRFSNDQKKALVTALRKVLASAPSDAEERSVKAALKALGS